MCKRDQNFEILKTELEQTKSQLRHITGLFEELRTQIKSNIKYQQKIESTFNFIQILDKSGIIKYGNYTDHELNISSVTGTSVFDLVESKYWDVFRDKMRLAFNGLYSQLETLDKHGKYFLNYFIPYEVNEEEIILISIEISEIKITSKALKSDETMYRSLVQSIPGMIYRANSDWSAEIFGNIELISGYSRDEIKLKDENWFSIIHPDDKEQIYQEGIKLAENPARIIQRYRIVDRNGDIRWVEDRKSSFFENGKFKWIDGSVFDITNKKVQEEQLLESEERYRTLFETSPLGIVISRQNKVLYANKSFVKMFNYGEIHEVIDLFVSSFQPHELAEELVERGLNREKGCLEPTSYDSIGLKKQNIRFPMHVVVGRINLKDGPAVITFIQDITERKLSEEALRESENKYRRLIENSPNFIQIWDRDGLITYSNVGSSSMKTEEIIGIKVYSFFDEQNREKIQISVEKAFSSGMCIKEEVFNLYGSTYLAHFIALNEMEIMVISVDITERKIFEDEIFKISKLESMGILAGGIAHDFNNLLSGITGNISLARLSDKNTNEHDKYLLEAERASIRAKSLTNQLLTFAKGGIPTLEKIAIEKIVKESAQFILRGSNVKSEIILDDNLWDVEIDPGQISQVIQNMVINSIQSMPYGGLIKISVENLVDKPPSLDPNQQHFIRIMISDEGTGIEKEHINKIFDPFFTTKQNGSGLGLATSYSIIKQHLGKITVKSKVGAGTTIFIYLPASGKPHSKYLNTSNVKELYFHRSGKILVMDDDTAVQKVLNDMLTLFGFDVLLANDGEEAISKYQEVLDNDSDLELAILDLTISGGMGGKETVKTLLNMNPDIKAIVASGYSNDPVMSNYREFGFFGRIAKPFTFEELKAVLLNVLK